MKQEQFIKRRKEIRDKIEEYRKKERELRKQFQSNKFEKQKINIERYYINQFRKYRYGVFYYIGDELEKGTSGTAFVKGKKIRLENNKYRSGRCVILDINDSMFSLSSLRSTKPIKKKKVKELYKKYCNDIKTDFSNKVDIKI